MQCHEVQTHIDDYLDGLLNSTEVEKFTAHYRRCDQCADAVAQAQKFRQLLKNSPFPPPSAGFVDRALRTAVKQGRATHHDTHGHLYTLSHRKGFIRGFGSAVAAGLALWVVVSLYPAQQTSSQQSLSQQSLSTQTVERVAATIQDPMASTMSISLYEPTNITLAFHAVKAVQGATITIRLSDNLELAGYQNRQTLKWETDLLAGDNVLTLPIKALNPQQGKIIAQVSHSNLMKSIELQLNVQAASGATKPVSEFKLIATPLA